MMNHETRNRPIGILAGLAITAILLGPLAAAGQDAPPPPDRDQGPDRVPPALAGIEGVSAEGSPNFGRAAGELIGLNLVVWSYDRFIREGGTNPGFRIGFETWGANLENGWTWDDNKFATNQFSHPYHGSLYYNAARSNGYSYWQSIPFAFAGSFMWEFFGEVHSPAMNDWISTSMGGVALGEILHRLAGTVRDNTATGAGRHWGEVGGFLIDPVGGLNRIFDGDWSRVHANPEDRFPDNYRTIMDVGVRTLDEDDLWNTDSTGVFIEFDFEYGDPFFGDLGKPYDNFDFELQLNFGDKTQIGRINGNGNLAGTFIRNTAKSAHIISAFHRYEYINTRALEFGGQAVTAALLSRWGHENDLQFRSRLELGPIILAGSSSDHESVSGRSYDYGPGSAFNLELELCRRGWTYVELAFSHAWMHSISGNVADHHLFSTRLRLGVPVFRKVGLGAEFIAVNADRKYRDYEDVHFSNPQMKVFLNWTMN